MTAEVVNATLTVITPSSADAYISEQLPDNNAGSTALLHVRSGVTAWVDRCLFEFDLSSIPPGSIINSAYLQLYYEGWDIADPAGRTYNAYRVTKGWVEGDSTNGVTWNEANHIAAGHPGSCTDWTDGGDFTADGAASSTVPSSLGWMTWDVTSIVKAWIESGQSNYGFLIRDLNDGVAGTDSRAAFCSREWLAMEFTPVLKVDWSPTTSSGYVGGELLTANKLEILTPYLGLAGLIAAVSIVYIFKRCKD